MATYTYQFHTLYDPATGNWQNLSDTGTGTLSDGDGVGVGDFEVGPPAEIITGGTANDTDYLGTVVVDGFTFIAVQNISGRVSLYGQDGSPSFAPPTAFGTLSPAPQVNPVDFTTCFAAGTLIAAPNGEIEVETLTIGDMLLTQDGRTVPVKWIGRQTVHKLFTPAERFAPVRIAAGALGEGLPHTDLVLTADHALIIDDLAINAGALVNGTTITCDPIDSLPDRVTYYHIETENHDVILANGAPAETFVDYVGRKAFDNFAEYIDLYGEERAIYEMDRPRVSAARLLPPDIRARLADRKVA